MISLERGFVRLSCGMGLAAWLSLLLAELGRLSAEALLMALVALLSATLLVAAVIRSREGVRWPAIAGATARRPRRETRPGWREILGPALVLVAAALVFFPAYETVVWADDSTAYLNFAEQIHQSGGLTFEDPLLQRIPEEQRARLFRNSMPEDATGEYARFPGGFLIPDIGEARVTAGFSPLFPVLQAAMRGILGPAGMLLVAPLFGLLSVAAVFLLGSALGGRSAGYLAAVLLTVSLPQIWFSRYGLPEPVAQFFVLSGALALIVSRHRRSPVFCALAGALLGMGALAKVDLLVLTGVSLLVFAGGVLLAHGRWPKGLGWFLAGFGLPVTHLVIHYSIFSSHYVGYVAGRLRRSFLAQLWSGVAGQGWTVGMLVLAALLVGLLLGAALALLRRIVPTYREGRNGRSRWKPATGPRLLGAALLGLAAANLVNYFASTRFTGVGTARWLGVNLSWPLLGLAVVGGARLLARGGSDWRRWLLPVLATIVGVLYVYNPHTSPGELWSFRRFVPVVVPSVAVLGAVGATSLTGMSLTRRMDPGRVRAIAGLLAAALVLVVAAPSLILLGDRPWAGAREWLRDLASRYPADSLVLVSPELAGTHLAMSLGYLHDLDAVLVQEHRPDPGVLQPLIQDALSSGRNVHLVLGSRGFELYAPRLSLELRHEDDLVVAGLEETGGGGLRRIGDRSMPLTLVGVGLRPAGPPRSIDIGDRLEDMLFRPRGFHAPERPARDAAAFRWTGTVASLTLPAFREARLLLASGRRGSVEPPAIDVRLDDELVVARRPVPEEKTWVTVRKPPPVSNQPVELTIRSDTFNPRREGMSDDPRDLGVMLYEVEIDPAPGLSGRVGSARPDPGAASRNR